MRNEWILIILMFFGLGCASKSYVFSSKPSGAAVYYQNPDTNERMLIGSTPMSYSKSLVKGDRAFLVSFEKKGYFSSSLPIAPTDEMRTTVAVQLKKDPSGTSGSAEMVNEVVAKLFGAQKLIYEKRYRSAIIELDKLLEEHEWLTQAHVMKGTSFYLMNEMGSATEAWKAAYALDPENDEFNQFLREKNIKFD